MKNLFLIMMLISFSLFAQEVDPTFFKAGKLNHVTSDWAAIHPTPGRIFLTHKTKNQYVLISEFKSELTPEAFEEYLAGDYSQKAKEERELTFKNNDVSWSQLETGTNTLEGVRYGGLTFKLSQNDSKSTFYERVWAENGRIWQVTLVTQEEHPEHNQDMNHFMRRIMNAPQTSSFKSAFLFSAIAAEPNCPGNCPPKAQESYKDLRTVLPLIAKNSKCSNLNLPAKNGPFSYGLKIGPEYQLRKGCSEVPAALFKELKIATLAGLDVLASRTEKEISKFGCDRYKPKSNKAKTWFDYFSMGQASQTYSDCLTAAATSATIKTTGDGLTQLARGSMDLIRWLKAGNNPALYLVTYVAKEVTGFMCVNAEAQAHALCEFQIKAAAAIAGVAITVASGGSAASVGALAVGRTAATLSLREGLSVATKVVRHLPEPKKPHVTIKPKYQAQMTGPTGHEKPAFKPEVQMGGQVDSRQMTGPSVKQMENPEGPKQMTGPTGSEKKTSNGEVRQFNSPPPQGQQMGGHTTSRQMGDNSGSPRQMGDNSSSSQTSNGEVRQYNSPPPQGQQMGGHASPKQMGDNSGSTRQMGDHHGSPRQMGDSPGSSRQMGDNYGSSPRQMGDGSSTPQMRTPPKPQQPTGHSTPQMNHQPPIRQQGGGGSTPQMSGGSSSGSNQQM